jgi:hypothetical protein
VFRRGEKRASPAMQMKTEGEHALFPKWVKSREGRVAIVQVKIKKHGD